MRKIIFSIIALFVIGACCVDAIGAEKSDDDLVVRAMEGQDLVFARRYGDAMKIFEALKRDYPNSPAGDFGMMAALEMQMLEQEDFHLEQEFNSVTREGLAKVARIMQRSPGTWDLFLSGSLIGMDGFFKARKGKWWDAYTQGTKSRQIFHHVKELDPNFIDADFGLGMYIFWRSVFARDLWFLKMLPDRRQEGIGIVERVANKGRFAKELAWVNLAVMYFEEGRYADAQKILEDYVGRFPNNVILRTILGKVYVVQKRYDDAIKQFRAILAVAPNLKKPHYFIGATYIQAGDKARFDEAERELNAFIGMETKSKYWPASAHYWLGRLAEAKGGQAKAKAEYEAAIGLYPKALEAQKRVRALGGGI